jgi:PncC family amidohydrolase
MLNDDILNQSRDVVELYRQKHRKVALAESCTGGLLSAAITYNAGASDMYERGFVTYANEAKMEELSVPSALLRTFGAVSPECAEAMAKGVQRLARADVGLSITGIAGPGGGHENKPVGLVYIGLATAKSCEVHKFNFKGNRKDIRQDTVKEALAWLFEFGKQF